MMRAPSTCCLAPQTFAVQDANWAGSAVDAFPGYRFFTGPGVVRASVT